MKGWTVDGREQDLEVPELCSYYYVCMWNWRMYSIVVLKPRLCMTSPIKKKNHNNKELKNLSRVIERKRCIGSFSADTGTRRMTIENCQNNWWNLLFRLQPQFRQKHLGNPTLPQHLALVCTWEMIDVRQRSGESCWSLKSCNFVKHLPNYDWLGCMPVAVIGLLDNWTVRR